MNPSPPRIDNYRFGEIIIDGVSYQKDVIILPDKVIPNWWREKGHSLSVRDLEQVLAVSPQILLIGCGAYRQMRVPKDTRETLEEQGIDVRVYSTSKACEAYQEVRQEEGIAVALHLTC
jgi:hypothetical protein